MKMEERKRCIKGMLQDIWMDDMIQADELFRWIIKRNLQLFILLYVIPQEFYLAPDWVYLENGGG